MRLLTKKKKKKLMATFANFYLEWLSSVNTQPANDLRFLRAKDVPEASQGAPLAFSCSWLCCKHMVRSSPGKSTAHTTLFFFFPGLLLCRIGFPMQSVVLHHKLACMTEWERWVGMVSRVGPGAKKLLWGRVMGTTSWKARDLQLNHGPPSGFLPVHSGLLVRVKGKPLHPSTCLCSLFLG